MVIEIASGRRRSRPARRRARPGRRGSGLPSLFAILLFTAVAALGLAPEGTLDEILDRAIPRGGEIVAAHGVRVTDGDTIRIGQERIRIENIDTPELGSGAECLAERRLADLALQNAAALFGAATEVSIARTGQDQYGRTLARVSIDGRDFGRTMISTGYAAEWTGRRTDWCGG